MHNAVEFKANRQLFKLHLSNARHHTLNQEQQVRKKRARPYFPYRIRLSLKPKCSPIEFCQQHLSLSGSKWHVQNLELEPAAVTA